VLRSFSKEESDNRAKELPIKSFSQPKGIQMVKKGRPDAKEGIEMDII
jgi:hypothetical protein